MDFEREQTCILKDSVIYKLLLFDFHLPFNLTLCVLLNPSYRFTIYIYLINRFRPQILMNASKIDLTTTILGLNIAMPIMIAPTALQKMAHPEGTDCSALQ